MPDMPPRITWDETKESANRRKHGVAFREAIEALRDPLGLSELDESHDPTEIRWTTIGQARTGRFLRVTTAESGPTIRIIAARRATARERNAYEEEP
jgi:uncharacterized DUF497 family protein